MQPVATNRAVSEPESRPLIAALSQSGSKPALNNSAERCTITLSQSLSFAKQVTIDFESDFHRGISNPIGG